MKQSEFFSSLLPLAQKAGEALPDQSDGYPGTSGYRVGLGTEPPCLRASQLFRHHCLRPSQCLVERRRHRAGRPFPPFPCLQLPRRLLHGLRPPDPFGLPVCRRRQRRPGKPSPARSPTANTSAKSTATTVPPIRLYWSKSAERSVFIINHKL